MRFSHKQSGSVIQPWLRERAVPPQGEPARAKRGQLKEEDEKGLSAARRLAPGGNAPAATFYLPHSLGVSIDSEKAAKSW